MKLTDITTRLQDAGLLVTADADAATKVTALAYDSRAVTPGALFFCKGRAFKAAYLDQALKNGAVAYVAEQAYPDRPGAIVVSDIRRAMAVAADTFYQSPWRAFAITGITGTKGKTTTTLFLKAILDQWSRAQGKPATGVLSSVVNDVGAGAEAAQLTTPEALPLFQYLATARANGLPFVSMEVSSQALKYHRTDEIEYDVVAFLNISEDHISPLEHPTFDDYFQSKLKLFSQGRVAVVNKDSDHFEEILQAANDSPTVERILTVSLTDASADYYVETAAHSERWQTFTAHTPRGEATFTIGMLGTFNISNALVAIAIAETYGVPTDVIQMALPSVRAAGRMETLTSRDGQRHVLIDFAHNPLSFHALFETAREWYPGAKIGIVFGATGDKAVQRRYGLAEAAAQAADRIVLTTDDPGSEDPAAIARTMQDVIAAHGKTATIELDRGRAIDALFHWAEMVDGPTVLLLAGKGNETTMKINGKNEPYAGDRYYAEQVLARYDQAHGNDAV